MKTAKREKRRGRFIVRRKKSKRGYACYNKGKIQHFRSIFGLIKLLLANRVSDGHP